MATPKTAPEILKTVIEGGRENLTRANAGLALSGLAAGPNIFFSALALGVVGAMTGGVGLVAMLFYPAEFLIVVPGLAQLFTETNNLPNMLRFWAVVFASDILGTAIFAAAVTYGNLLDPAAFGSSWGAAHNVEPGYWTRTLKAVSGGWLVALVALQVAACKATVSQGFSIYVLCFLIPAAGPRTASRARRRSL